MILGEAVWRQIDLLCGFTPPCDMLGVCSLALRSLVRP